MAEEEDYHNCHFCSDLVKNGLDTKGERHWISDCRPDLVEHEPGKLCTWYGWGEPDNRPGKAKGKNCYAYQNRDTYKWEDEHIHFYTDGPM